MYLTTDGAVTDAAGDLAVVPDGDRPAGRVRPEPALHRADRDGRQQLQTTGSPAASTSGTTRSRGTPSAPAPTGCDWKVVYDTGAGHQVTALAANGTTTYAAWCGGCNPPTFGAGPGHELRRHLARAVAGGRPEPLHHLDRGRPGERGARLHQRRLLQPALDPGRRRRPRLRVDQRRGLLDRRHRQPARRAGLQGRHGRRQARRRHRGRRVRRRRRTSGSPLPWSQLGTGLPNVTVWDLTVAAGGLVVAGTHGRGDWQIKLG